MTRKLALNEQETTMTIEATDRSVVRVYTGDEYFQRRLERVGATLVRDCIDGGKFYQILSSQLRLTKVRQPMSEERKETLRQQLEAVREKKG